MPQRRELDSDELLYRRISLRNNPPYFEPSDRTILQQAFIPNRHDIDGLTVVRANYRSAEEVACPPNSPHRDYVVAVIRACDLANLGLTLDVTPDEIDQVRGGTPAHVSIREINIDSYRKNSASIQDWARCIAETLVIEVRGPFPL